MFTIFYSKTTGRIYNCIKSEVEQDYTCFADRENDYRQILNKIVVEDIPGSLNLVNYKIENGKFILKEEKTISEFTPKLVEQKGDKFER